MSPAAIFSAADAGDYDFHLFNSLGKIARFITTSQVVNEHLHLRLERCEGIGKAGIDSAIGAVYRDMAETAKHVVDYGGRGGFVYHVTKLDRNFNHNEPGTLRYGLNDANSGGQPRTIVFDVAGTFWLGRFGAERGHYDGWDTQSRINLGSNVTIAGQTAPGPVHIMGGTVKAGSNNAILRNVTIAPGYGMRTFEKPDDDPPQLPFPGDGTRPRDFPDSYAFDAIDITGSNLMIDHVTTVYATDETISANELANNITIQDSNISQGQNYPQANAEGGGNYTGHALGSR